MGSYKSLPAVGEAATLVESSTKLIAAGAAAGFGNEKAQDLFADAGDAWVEYSERNLIAAPIRASIHRRMGDDEQADLVIRSMSDSVEDLVDDLPVVGHVKGAVHYSLGDEAHGDACMRGASRNLAVCSAATAAGVVTAGPGVLAVAAAAAGAGMSADIVTSGLDSYRHDEWRPAGIIAGVDHSLQSGNPVHAVDTALMVAADVAAGPLGAQDIWAKQKLRSSSSKSCLSDGFGELETDFGKDAPEEESLRCEDTSWEDEFLAAMTPRTSNRLSIAPDSSEREIVLDKAVVHRVFSYSKGIQDDKRPDLKARRRQQASRWIPLSLQCGLGPCKGYDSSDEEHPSDRQTRKQRFQSTLDCASDCGLKFCSDQPVSDCFFGVDSVRTPKIIVDL